MSKYLFIRKSDGAPVYGDTKFHVKQPGQYAPDPSDDLSRLTIIDRMNRNEIVDLSKPISYFLKEDGSPYANYAELDAAMAGFFFRVANNTGAPWKKFAVVGADGIETGQDPLVITGTTDFTLPSDCDVTKAMIVLNPFEVSYTLVIVEGVDKIRFTQAPRVGDTPSIYYQTK